MSKKSVNNTHPKRDRKIVRRKLAQLKPHPYQSGVFTDLSDDALQELADDMATHGLTNPVEITPEGTIMAGHGRVAAAKRLGWTDIDCWLRDDLSSEEVDRRHVEDNLNRRQLSELEFARAYKRLRELGSDNIRNGSSGDLRDLIGQRLGLSGRTLDRLARVLETPIEIQRAFDRRQINQKDALAVARLDKADQKKIAKSIAGGMPPKEAIARHGDAQQQGPMPKTTLARLVRAMEEADVALRPVLHKFSTLAARHVPGLQIGRQLADDLIRQITGNDRIADAVKQLATKNGAPRR